MRTIIARTINDTLVVAEIREDGSVWYAVQDAQQSNLAQHNTKRAAMADWRARTVGPMLHAGVYSARRRNTVHLCDGETISPQTTDTDAAVTCPRCQRVMTA